MVSRWRINPLPGGPAGRRPILLIDAKGANRLQLSFNETDYFRPSWSPEGRSLVYDAGGDMFIFDIASGTSRALTMMVAAPMTYKDAQASWSPMAAHRL